MALRRYRPARYRDHYVVLDHGEPNEDGVYVQDGDPENENTVTRIVWSGEPVDAADAGAMAVAHDEAHWQAGVLNSDWERNLRKSQPPVPVEGAEV